MEGQIDGRTDGQTDDGWIEGRKHGRMDGRPRYDARNCVLGIGGSRGVIKGNVNMVLVCYSKEQHQFHPAFERFDAATASPLEVLSVMVHELSRDIKEIRKDLHSRLETIKYEITCEIRKIKEELTKDDGDTMGGRMDAVSVEVESTGRRTRRVLRRLAEDSDVIKQELNAQKAEIYAVRNSVYDVRDHITERSSAMQRQLNHTNSTLVCHMDDLRGKLYKINNNLALILQEQERLVESVSNRQHTPRPSQMDDDNILPGCTLIPPTPTDFESQDKDYLNESYSQAPPVPTPAAFGGDNLNLPTLPEDCHDENAKRSYLEYPPMPRDCKDVFDFGFMESGVYRIQPPGLSSREVFCEQSIAGGGWTALVVRKKLPRHISFNRTWHEYEVGFGDPNKEYWLGLKGLHALTAGRPHQLRVDMEDWDGNSAFASYAYFT
ncbi:unnamed protein product, partial [Meganyctiphanes norvegica]